MIEHSLFSKYGEMKLKPSGTLFDIDLLVAVNERKCPLCFCKLYEMRNKPFLYCKGTKHKDKFLIHKDKIKHTPIP